MGPDRIGVRVFTVSGRPGKDGVTPELTFAGLAGNPNDNEILRNYITQKVADSVAAELEDRIEENALGQYINTKVAEAIANNLTDEINAKVEEVFNENFQHVDDEEF